MHASRAQPLKVRNKNDYCRSFLSLHIMPIPGILVRKNNQTYGREKKKNGRRLLYKFIPFTSSNIHPQESAFLVPYQMKPSLNKCFVNLYAMAERDDGQHTQGKITEIIGPVDLLSAFYEYQLRCYRLTPSIQDFCRAIYHTPAHNSVAEMAQYSTPIFSIDAPGTQDRDDALSIYFTHKGRPVVTVFISNPVEWFERRQLWSHAGRRIATVYLPGDVRRMLPKEVGGECSLDAGTRRNVFGISFELNDSDQWGIPTLQLYTVEINHNFDYTETIDMPEYKSLFAITRQKNPEVTTSSKLVQYWMTEANTAIAKLFSSCQVPCVIYRRSDIHTNKCTPAWICELNDRDAVPGKYTCRATEDAGYCPITCPLRRVVDLINGVAIYRYLRISLSTQALEFCDRYCEAIEDLNIRYKHLQKVQRQCVLMHKCHNDPRITETPICGWIVDKTVKDDGEIKYMIYLESMRLFHPLKSREERPLYSKQMCRMYLFMKKDSVHQKVRIQWAGDADSR